MGLWNRLKLLLGVKATSALDRAEDPREVLDYAYSQQQELLATLRRGLVDVATAKQQLEQQAAKLQERIPRLDEQARRALQSGREDLARVALERRHAAAAEIDGLQHQLSEVGAEEDRLAAQERALALRIDEFRTHREVVSARYSAASAEVSVREALSGVTGDLAELGRAVGRAEEKTERLQARAKALGSLVDVGALPSTSGDYLEAELGRITTGKEIDDELARLRAELALPRLAAATEESPDGKR